MMYIIYLYIQRVSAYTNMHLNILPSNAYRLQRGRGTSASALLPAMISWFLALGLELVLVRLIHLGQ